MIVPPQQSRSPGVVALPILRIALLGAARFAGPGGAFAFSAPPRTLPLLAYLLLHREPLIPRERLAAAIWPDADESDGRSNLRRHLQYLQRALPPPDPEQPWLIGGSRTLHWNRACSYEFDVEEFERLSASPAGRAQALELYSGDLLEACDDEWLYYERERLRNLQLANYAELIAEARAQRDFTRALTYATRLSALEPWREDVIRQIVEIRHALGDRSGAIAEFRRFSKRLFEEMGVAPTAETAAAYERALGDVSGAAAAAFPPSFGARTLPFVGRERELDALATSYARANQGRGSFTLIGGEAGIGKSRLCEALAEHARREGALVLRGATSVSQHVPYEPVVDALRSHIEEIGAFERRPARRATLAKIFPELQAPAGSAPRIGSPYQQMRIFESLAETLVAASQRAPLLVVLEDLHWASAATIALVEYLARAMRRSRVMLVATYREEEALREHPLRAMRRRLAGEGALSHLALGPLDLESVRAIVGTCTNAPGGNGEHDEVALRLLRQSDGNPFFLSELLRNAPAVGGDDDESVPRSVGLLIEARVAQLSSDAQAAAQLAAVAGNAFSLEVLHDASGWGESRLLDALDELLEHQILREIGRSDRTEYAFSHHLVHAAVYARNGAAMRRRRHRRIANVLEKTAADLPRNIELIGQLAVHFDLGGEPERAAAYFRDAAAAALEIFANEDALRFAQHGLAHTTDPRLRAALLFSADEAHRRAGNRAEQHKVLDELAGVADALGDAEIRREWLYRSVRLANAVGDRDAAAELLARFERITGDDAVWKARVLAEHAAALLERSEYRRAMPILSTAVELFNASGDAVGEVHSLLMQFEVARRTSGRFEEVAGKARAAAMRAGSHTLALRTMHATCVAETLSERFGAAYESARQFLAQAEAAGDRILEAFALRDAGLTALFTFRIREARNRLESAKALFARVGRPGDFAENAVYDGIAAYRVGDFAASRHEFEKAIALSREHELPASELSARLNFAETLVAAGEFDEAEALAADADRLGRTLRARDVGLDLGSLRARMEVQRGRFGGALRGLLGTVAERRKQRRMASLAADLVVLASAYLGAGRIADATAVARELVLLALERRDDLFAPQQALAVAASAYERAGDRSAARDLKERAQSLYRERLAAIPDEPSRVAFAAAPWNRDL